MEKCLICGYEGEDGEMVKGTDMCEDCFQEEQEEIKEKNNPLFARLNWEQKRNFKLNELLMETVKIIENCSIDNEDLVNRIKKEIIWC